MDEKNPRHKPEEAPDVSRAVADPKVAHEESDVSVKAVAIFLVALLALTGLIYVAMLGTFGLFSAREEKAEPPPTSLTRSVDQNAPPEKIFPEPRLQIDPRSDLEKDRAREQTELETYGWEDPIAGTIRIPIDRAKDLLLERGLPHLEASPGAKQTAEGSER